MLLLNSPLILLVPIVLLVAAMLWIARPRYCQKCGAEMEASFSVGSAPGAATIECWYCPNCDVEEEEQ